MKKQLYALEEKLLWYSVRIIKNDILEETEELIEGSVGFFVIPAKAGIQSSRY